MSEIDKLLELMGALRNPDGGCPWDLEQDFASIAPYTIEEAYEVADAIARNDMPDLESELGDLLLQVVFHAQMAREAGLFDFDDVARSITGKIRRRHPHVFGDGEARTAGKVAENWEHIKADERAGKGDDSALAGIALALPALKRAEKLGKRAAWVGFDWPDALGPADKVHEELDEIAAAAETGVPEAIDEEVGDALFAMVNLARHHGVDSEAALQRANRKFERRFRELESAVAERGASVDALPLEALEEIWQAVKEGESG